MKKIGIFFYVIFLFVVVGWLGLTFVFSNSVESWIDQGLGNRRGSLIFRKVLILPEILI